MKKISKLFLILTLALFITAPTLFYGVIYYRYTKIKPEIVLASKTYNVNENLVIAVAYVESKFCANAVSSKGAVGVMQIMPKTAKFIGESCGFSGEINLKNAKTNITIGVAYLQYLMLKYSSVITVLACYNAGEGNVIKWQTQNNNAELKIEKIPFKETANYVKKVLKIYDRLNNSKR